VGRDTGKQRERDRNGGGETGREMGGGEEGVSSINRQTTAKE